MKKTLCLIMLFFLSTILFSQNQKRFVISADLLKNSLGNYILFISKKNFELMVVEIKTQEIKKKFQITIGKNAGKKIISSDDKTPEGEYIITEILSLNAPKNSISYKKLKEKNALYWKAKDGHYKYGKVSEDLGSNAYGPRFLLLSYPNHEDKTRFQSLKKEGKISKNSKLGWIAIHGTNDPESLGKRASSGCIRLLNTDIIQLDPFIKVGTLVIIEPE